LRRPAPGPVGRDRLPDPLPNWESRTRARRVDEAEAVASRKKSSATLMESSRGSVAATLTKGSKSAITSFIDCCRSSGRLATIFWKIASN
jgi:hypothetical protein